MPSPHPPEAPRQTGTEWRAWHAPLGLLCLVLAGCTKPSGAAEAQGPKGAGAETKTVTLVETEPLQRGSIEEVLERTAEIQALVQVPILTRVGGRVKAVHVDYGDPVEEGQLLLEIEDQEFVLEEQRMAASLEDAKDSGRLSQIALEEAEDQAATALLRKEQAQREYDRTLQLSESRIASKSELEAKKLALDDAEAEERAATFRKRRAEVDAAQSEHRVRLAEIAWRTAQLQLSYTKVLAPFAGAIAERSIDSGLLVSVNHRAFILVDDQHLVVDVKITQKDLLRVAVGQSVEITAREALPGRVFHGTVERIQPVVEVASGSLVTRVRIVDGEDSGLRPGLFVQCKILTEVVKDSLLVPRRAVFWQDQNSVFFLVEDGVAHRVEFEAGPSTGPYAQVLNPSRPDLEAGMPVVVIGKDRLADGDPVRLEAAPIPGTADAVAAPPSGDAAEGSGS